MLDTESQSKIIVEVFSAAMDAMKKLGLSDEEALNGDFLVRFQFKLTFQL